MSAISSSVFVRRAARAELCGPWAQAVRRPLWWLNPLDYAYNEINAPRHMKLPKPVLDDADGDGVTDQFDLEPNTPKGCPVDTHGVCELEPAEGDPIRSLDELEIGGIRIELQPQQHRQREIDQRGPKGDVAGVAGDHRLIAARRQDEPGADERHKGHQREERPMAHNDRPVLTAATGTR